MDFLLGGILATTWKDLVMYCVGGILIYLAIRKNWNPRCFCRWASERFS